MEVPMIAIFFLGAFTLLHATDKEAGYHVVTGAPLVQVDK